MQNIMQNNIEIDSLTKTYIDLNGEKSSKSIQQIERFQEQLIKILENEISGNSENDNGISSDLEINCRNEYKFKVGIFDFTKDKNPNPKDYGLAYPVKKWCKNITKKQLDEILKEEIPIWERQNGDEEYKIRVIIYDYTKIPVNNQYPSKICKNVTLEQLDEILKEEIPMWERYSSKQSKTVEETPTSDIQITM